MIAVHNIRLGFGERELFKGISFRIGSEDRIGLVGSNGSGKTTLLRILAGLREPDEGRIEKAHYVTVGYLPQEGISVNGRTLYDEAATAFEDILEIERKLEEARNELTRFQPESGEYAETLHIIGELQHRLEDADAYRMKSKIEKVLIGLGFGENDFGRMTEEFSGGWQMRLELAKLLLREPSVLLLDEPTNHLDLESLQWLEAYLKKYDGAVVLVSHDRAFLNGLTTRTVALSRGALEEYAGNYSFYVTESALRREQAERELKNQQKQIERTQAFIDRFRYKATKARQVQSRIKMLEKMEVVEVETDERSIGFRFPSPQPSGRSVIELKGIVKRYGSLTVFNGAEYGIERGDKIAVVGVNGAGKSTIVRIIAGIEPFDAGERTLGHNVTLSYFGQHQAEELDLSKDAIGILEEVAEGEIRKKLRTILGSFLFHGDDVFKRVSVLSGGEKSRLALAKMLLKPANFLIMDEPTNHLDMASKEILQQALADYEGTFVIVSHDRDFLEPLINKVLEVSPGGNLKTYLGTMSDYISKKREETERARGKQVTRKSVAVKMETEKERKQREAEERLERSRKLKPLKEKLGKIEADIAGCEHRKNELEQKMANPDFYKQGAEAKAASDEYRALGPNLDRLYREWEEVNKTIEGI